MSCEHDHCTCDHTDTSADTDRDRHLPTVSGTERHADRPTGCCGGDRHADEPAPAPAPGN